MKLKKIIGVVILICTCSVSFFCGIQYINVKREDVYRRVCLNKLYRTINNTVFLLSSVNSWGKDIKDTDTMTNPYITLQMNIEDLIILSQQTSIYNSETFKVVKRNKSFSPRTKNTKVFYGDMYYSVYDKNYNTFNDFANSLEWLKQSIFGGLNCQNGEKSFKTNSFLADGVLSKKEIAFLTNLKDDFEKIRLKMYSKETGQENPDLSTEKLAEIIKPFADKYSEFMNYDTYRKQLIN